MRDLVLDGPQTGLRRGVGGPGVDPGIGHRGVLRNVLRNVLGGVRRAALAVRAAVATEVARAAQAGGSTRPRMIAPSAAGSATCRTVKRLGAARATQTRDRQENCQRNRTNGGKPAITVLSKCVAHAHHGTGANPTSGVVVKVPSVAPPKIVARLGKKVMTLASESCMEPAGGAPASGGVESGSRWLTSSN